MNRFLVLLLTCCCLLVSLGTGCSRSRKAESYLASANRYYDQKQYEKAKLEYINVMKRQPTNAVAIVRLGKIFYRQGQLREAYPYLVESRTIAPDDLEVAQALATLFIASGQSEKARIELTTILQKQPTNDVSILTLPDTIQKPKDAQDVLAMLNGIQQKVGPRSSIHLARARLAQRAGDAAKVETELTSALRLDPKSSMAHQSLGLLRWSQGATNLAEAEFRTAAKLAPTSDSAHIRLALFLSRTGKSDDAKAVLETITREVPDKIDAWRLLADIALREKRYDDCSAMLERAQKIAPNDPESRLLQGQLRLAQQKPEQAITILQSLAETAPHSSDVQYQLGLAYMLNRDVPQATASFGRAIALDTNNVAAAITFAEVNISRGQTAPAITVLNDLVRRFPTLSRAQFLLGRAHLVAARYEDAIGVYTAMQKRFPDDAAVPLQLGLLYAQLKRFSEARRAFDQAHRLAPNEYAPLEQLVNLNLNAGAPKEALAVLQPELERYPKVAQLWVLRAKIYLASKDSKAAEEVLMKAIELDPNSQPAYLLLAELKLQAGSPDESIKRLNELLAKRSDNITAWMLLGVIQSQLGNDAEALKAYQTILKLNPSFVMALNNSAYLLGKHPESLAEGYKLASKARQLDPKKREVLDTLGWIEYLRGNYIEAVRTLGEAQEDLATEPEFQAHLGLVNYMLGNESEARRWLQLAKQRSEKLELRDLIDQRLATLSLLSSATGQQLIEGLEAQRQKDPKDFLALLHLGRIYAGQGDTKRAREYLEAANKLNPSQLDPLIQLAALETNENPTRAMELARQAQRISPDDPMLNQTLGRLALKAGDLTGAYGLLQVSARQMTNDARVWFELSQAAFATGRIGEAQDAVRTAQRIGLPSSQTNAAALFANWIELGQNPPAAAAAMARLEAAAKSDPNNPPLLYALAMAMEQQGKMAPARDTHEKILQQYPSFTPSIRQLAILYAEQFNNDTKAYELATKARIALTKDDGLAKTLGKLAYRRGDYRYAVQLFNEVARNQPKDADLQFNLGLAYLKLKQNADGRAALEKAIAIDPKGTFVTEARKLLAETKAG